VSINVIGERQFNSDDQERFAELSGDINPLHTDSIVSRRTMAGVPVVHGMHVLCWAIDNILRSRSDLPAPTSLKVAFRRMIYPGDRLRIVIVKESATRLCASAVVDDISVMTVEFGKEATAGSDLLPDDIGLLHEPVMPVSMTLNDIANCHGHISIRCTSASLSRMFPVATAVLGAERMAALVRISYLVGMVCPGLHSMLGGMNLMAISSDSLTADCFAFRVTASDERFRRLSMNVGCPGWSGTVDAFVRPEPQAQPSIAKLGAHVKIGEFSGANALIVGGSRGLGELTAKLIACGGGHVTVSYRVGDADARRVQSEIVNHGGHCDILQFDVLRSGTEQLGRLNCSPSQIYYMATPPIFGRATTVFNDERFRTFLAVYVTGFHEIWKQMNSGTGRPVAMFYPSSIAVETRPRGMTEYAMAKAAGEALCADLEAAKTRCSVVVERLPRLSTDQTATLMEVATANATAVMLPILRKMILPR
jgi:MaoC dehydratase-like protein